MDPLFDANLFTRKVVGDLAIYDNSLLFRAGTFPNRIVNGKPLTITPDHLSAICKNFSAPIGANIQHTNFLKGKAAHILSVVQEGAELRGTVSIPLWLDEHLDDAHRKVSVELDPHSFDSLVGLALCTNPAITDAQLMTAQETWFAAKHTTHHGQSAMQNLHDTAARAGAICEKPDKDDAKMTSKPEAKGFQTIHDHAVANGASCNSPMYYTEDPHNRTTIDAQPSESNPGAITHLKDNKLLKLSDIKSSLLALFTSKGIEVEDDTVTDPSGVVHTLLPMTAGFVEQNVTKSAEFIAEQTKSNELAGKLEKFEQAAADKFTADNEIAVDAVIAVGKFEVTEREGLLVKRASNPALFDELTSLVPIKPEFAPVTTPGTVDAQVVAAALDKKPSDTSLDATKSALSFNGVSPQL